MTADHLDARNDLTTGVRLWPGVLIVIVQWLAVFGTGLIAPGSMLQFFGMMSGPLLTLMLFLGWWWGSRAPRDEQRLGGWLPIVAVTVTAFFLHRSMPQAFVIYGLSVLSALFVAWAAATRGCRAASRKRALIAVVLAVCGLGLMLRSSGVDGDMGAQFAWRWQATPEERLLADTNADLVSAATTAGSLPKFAEWPGFRGAGRDGIAVGTRIGTDWQASPPVELWRRPVGPGWGSFAVALPRLYTQEQRGDDEVVACYDATSGAPVWMHRDSARFWEALAGAGPRATPTLHGDRVYSLGATGVVNALDAATGALVWSRDLVTDTDATIPDWGFSSSPLVVGNLVIVHGGGDGGKKAVVAYDVETGATRWFGAAGTLSYSSVQRVSLDGVPQLLIATNAGITSLAEADGSPFWRHEWKIPGAARIVQPAIAANGDVLLGTGSGMGVRRLAIGRSGDEWTVDERWTSARLKPYFNDFVVHKGHGYGFDGRILAAMDLETGERVWKGGRYGSGQALLLADQDLLLVLSDRGEVALVAADPSRFDELARMSAIKGKTWNHPVVVSGVLYVRNGEEMAAFRLPTARLDRVVGSLRSTQRRSGLGFRAHQRR